MTIKNQNILMFAPWFPPHRNSEANATGKLALAILRQGWNLDVIASEVYNITPFYVEQDLWRPLKEITHIIPNMTSSLPLRIISRVHGILTTGHPIKGISWAQNAVHKGFELAKKYKYDIILSRSQPPEGHLPALILSKKLGIPWIANWNDIEPACKAPEPYGKGVSGKTTYFFERYLRSIIHNAYYHTFPSERSRIYMGNIFPEIIRKSSVIPHIAIQEDSQKSIVPKESIFKLCHAGTFDGRRDPAPFFEALTNFVSKLNSKAIKVILLGNSYDGIMKFALPQQLQDYIEIKPWTNYTETLKALRAADVLVIIEAPLKEGIYLSGKFVDYVQCRKPILAVTPLTGTLSDIISRYGGGINADCTSPKTLQEALNTLYTYWKNSELETMLNSDRIYNYFSEKTILSQYEELFAQFQI